MVQRRKRTPGSGIVLSVLATVMLVVVAIPSSPARAADDTEAPPAMKTYSPQAEDQDRPHDKSLLEKTPADAAVASKAQAAEAPAFYQRWQFWAVTTAIVVGAVAAIWGGETLYHSLHGGDIRPCKAPPNLACAGQGEPQ
jgi:hypothetical protein